MTTKINSVNREMLQKYFNTYCNKMYGKLFPLTDSNISNYINDCIDYYYYYKNIEFVKKEIIINKEELKILLYPVRGQFKEIVFIKNTNLLPLSILNRYDKFLNNNMKIDDNKIRL